MTGSVYSVLPQVAVGAIWGVVDFFFSTIAQKICLLAGVVFKESRYEEAAAYSQVLGKTFRGRITLPIAEECIFRGMLQPCLADAFLFYMPQLSMPFLFDIPIASVVAAFAIGFFFQAAGYSFYASGGKQLALIHGIQGVHYGLLKEHGGLLTSISAHIVHNLMVAWFVRCAPAFLKNPKLGQQIVDRDIEF